MVLVNYSSKMGAQRDDRDLSGAEDDSSWNSDSSGSVDGPDHADGTEVEHKGLAEQETRSVEFWRRIVLVCLLTTAALVAITTRAVLRQEASISPASGEHVSILLMTCHSGERLCTETYRSFGRSDLV
jgi:hypothetical protein